MKRNTQATGHDRPPTRNIPAGGLAPSDERDQVAPSQPDIDRKALGPRQIIQQAARDIARGLKDTDLHGTSSNVPGPAPRQELEPMVAPGGDRHSYADDQRAPAPEHPPGRGTPSRKR